jgi:hypothetical protein
MMRSPGRPRRRGGGQRRRDLARDPVPAWIHTRVLAAIIR